MAGLKLSVSRVAIAAPNDDIDIPQASEVAVKTSTSTSTVAGRLIDNTVDFIELGLKIGDIVVNETDKTMTTVTGVVDANTLNLTDDIVPTGKMYVIYSDTTTNAYFYVGVAGDIKITTSADTTVIIPNACVGWHPVNVKRIWASDTAATDILVAW